MKEYYIVMEGLEPINSHNDADISDGIKEMPMQPTDVYESKDRARRQIRNNLWNEEDPLEQRFYKVADGGYSVAEDDEGQLWLKAWKIIMVLGDSE